MQGAEAIQIMARQARQLCLASHGQLMPLQAWKLISERDINEDAGLGHTKIQYVPPEVQR